MSNSNVTVELSLLGMMLLKGVYLDGTQPPTMQSVLY